MLTTYNLKMPHAVYGGQHYFYFKIQWRKARSYVY